MKTYFITDIHGCNEQLKQVLDACKFSNSDTLICGGDVVDRGPDSYGVVETLLSIPNLISIKGNHDACFFEGLNTGRYSLMSQGCKETLESYIKNCNPDKEVYLKLSGGYTDFEFSDMPPEHYTFFKNQLPYCIDEDLNLFVHAGFNRHYYIEDKNHNDEDVLIWDRDLLAQARSYESMYIKDHPFKIKGSELGQFKEIFLGHTPVQYFGAYKPIKFANIWCCDTGAGKNIEGSAVTIMDIETKQIWKQLIK